MVANVAYDFQTGAPQPPVSARLSLSAIVLYEHFSVQFGLVNGQPITSGGGGDVGDPFTTDNFDGVTLIITVAGTGDPNNLVFTAMATADGTNYATASSGGVIGDLGTYLLFITRLLPDMKLVYASGGADLNATVTLVGRVD